jgi:predicted MFS family arabinose efflux permease
MDIQLLQGLLIGIMPFGGLFGSLTANYFTKKVTRRTGMNFMLPILILSIVLVQITKPLTLFLGRFFEGLSVGYYVSIAPIYLK